MPPMNEESEDDGGNPQSPFILRTAGAVGAFALIAGSALYIRHRRNLHPPPDPFEDPTNGMNNENPLYEGYEKNENPLYEGNSVNLLSDGEEELY